MCRRRGELTISSEGALGVRAIPAAPASSSAWKTSAPPAAHWCPWLRCLGHGLKLPLLVLLLPFPQPNRGSPALSKQE